MTQPSIKVGMIAEETGVLSIMGRANANVARMVVDEINAKGGLLGQKIELYLEDGANDRRRRAGQGGQACSAEQGGCDLRRHLQLHAAGHQRPPPSWRAGHSISTPSNTKGRNATR